MLKNEGSYSTALCRHRFLNICELLTYQEVPATFFHHVTYNSNAHFAAVYRGEASLVVLH